MAATIIFSWLNSSKETEAVGSTVTITDLGTPKPDRNRELAGE